MMRIGLLALSVAMVACSSSITPVPIHAGDICFRCRRSIAETQYAAEIINASMRAFKFRTPGCLAQYLDEHPQELQATFVTDYETKAMIGAETASFVSVLMDERTRERDYAAFKQPASAERFAAETGQSALLSWSDVLRERESLASGN